MRIVLAILMLVACSKQSDETSNEVQGARTAPKSNGGCDRREREGLCSEYPGSMATPAWVKEQCAAMIVPYIEKCPTEGATGRCVAEAGTAAETHTVYYGAAWPKDKFDMMCKPPLEARAP